MLSYLLGNQGQFVSLLESVVSVAYDPSDPPCQKVAFHLLARLTTHFGGTAQTSNAGNIAETGPQVTVPGYEQYIYEKLIPMAFEVPAMPTFNMKDGQALGVSLFYIPL